jgi:hypothetical protein
LASGHPYLDAFQGLSEAWREAGAPDGRIKVLERSHAYARAKDPANARMCGLDLAEALCAGDRVDRALGICAKEIGTEPLDPWLSSCSSRRKVAAEQSARAGGHRDPTAAPTSAASAGSAVPPQVGVPGAGGAFAADEHDLVPASARWTPHGPFARQRRAGNANGRAGRVYLARPVAG